MIRRIASVGFSRTRWMLGAFFVIGIAWGVRHWASHEGAVAVPPKPQAKVASSGKAAAPKEKKQAIVALVNGQTITHDEIAQECLRQHGKEVIESLANRYLVANHCREMGISVSQQEIDMEIDRIARKFSLPKEQYLKMLEKERGIQPTQYGEDIIWPTLALRKLAAPQLTVSPQELEEAYESQFGRAVKARLIVLNDMDKAKQVLAEARQKPEEFGALARKYSQDVNSASANGLIQPIRRHLGDPKIEEVAFKLKPGEISPIIPA
jgi:parvulin-like peptidyl-prolyl isomerase